MRKAVLVAVVVGVALSWAYLAPRNPAPRRHTDFLVTRIAAPVSALPLNTVRLLTPRLVLLAAAKAEVYWGGTRCTGITFDFQPLGDSRIAQAGWEAYPDSSQYLNCHITFNTDPTKIRTTFWHYCAAVIHEYGHLAGHPHSPVRTNIMFPSLSDQNVPRTCKKLVYP